MTLMTRIYRSRPSRHGGRGDPAQARSAQGSGRGTQPHHPYPHAELDLTDQAAVRTFMQSERPDIVILAAAKVGGIHANNTYPADFIYENLMIECNVIHQAFAAGVRASVATGVKLHLSARRAAAHARGCAADRGARAYERALRHCQDRRHQALRKLQPPAWHRLPLVMPTNLYGPGDNFHPENSHVLPALIRRFQEAVEQGADSVTIWGTGQPKREFLHVDDMAEASLFVLDLPAAVYAANTEPMLSHINVGSGADISILDLAHLIARTVGFKGQIKTDPSKPDGTMRKLMDVTRLERMGWKARISLEVGVRDAWCWYMKHRDTARV
jgi:GDP-L-fucose synthase